MPLEMVGWTGGSRGDGAFLAGLGLFLWLKTWPATAVAGVVVVGLAVVCDLALVATAWHRPRSGAWAVICPAVTERGLEMVSGRRGGVAASGWGVPL